MLIKAVGVLCFLVIRDNGVCYSQVNRDSISVIESAEVKWVNQFPSLSARKIKKDQSFGQILSAIAGSEKGENLEINKPVSVFAESPSLIWITDQGNGSLFSIKDEKISAPKVFSRQKFTGESLVGICSLPGRGILFTDSRLNKVFLLKNDGKSIEDFLDTVSLKQPTGIAFSGKNSEIWVIETAAHRISIFDIKGQKIKSFGSRGTRNGEFNYPTSISIDDSGYAFIVDALNYRIQIFDSSGNFIRTFGEAGNSSGYFAMPKGIATDSYGNIYVSDALFHVVQIFDKWGHFLYSFGSQGRGPGQFWMPSGIFIDRQDNIYVADSYNSRIQIFNLVNIVKRNE